MTFPEAPDQMKTGTSLIIFVLLSAVALTWAASSILGSQRDDSAGAVLFLSTRDTEKIFAIKGQVEELRAAKNVVLLSPKDASEELALLAAPKTLLVSASELPYRIRLQPAFGMSLDQLEAQLAPLLIQPSVSELLVTKQTKTFFHWSRALSGFTLLFAILVAIAISMLSFREVRTDQNREWKRALSILGVPYTTIYRNIMMGAVRRSGIVGLAAGTAIACLVIWLHFNASDLAVQMEQVSSIWMPVAFPIIVAPLLVCTAQTRAIKTL